jgi:hypothetical protein
MDSEIPRTSPSDQHLPPPDHTPSCHLWFGILMRNSRFPHVIDRMARVPDVDLFVLGHQPQQNGWSQAGDNLPVLASDHNHGCLLQIDLSRTYKIAELAASVSSPGRNRLIPDSEESMPVPNSIVKFADSTAWKKIWSFGAI